MVATLETKTGHITITVDGNAVASITGLGTTASPYILNYSSDFVAPPVRILEVADIFDPRAELNATHEGDGTATYSGYRVSLFETGTAGAREYEYIVRNQTASTVAPFDIIASDAANGYYHRTDSNRSVDGPGTASGGFAKFDSANGRLLADAGLADWVDDGSGNLTSASKYILVGVAGTYAASVGGTNPRHVVVQSGQEANYTEDMVRNITAGSDLWLPTFSGEIFMPSAVGVSGIVKAVVSGSQVTWSHALATGSELVSSIALAGNPTTTTQAAGDSSTKIATTAFVAAAVPNASYRTILQASGSHIAGKVAGTYAIPMGDPLAVSGTGTLYPIALIHYVAADYPTVNGAATKLRIRAQVECNDVAPTGNYTIGMYPVTRPAGSGGAGLCTYTLGTVVAGSNGATVTTPAADSSNLLVGSDFTPPSDGLYCLGVVTTGTVAASAHVHVTAQLQMRNA